MTNEELERAILAHGSSSYGKYLKTILQKPEWVKTYQRIMMR